jgi:hypothetical protein
MINENISWAKSILNKKGITEGTPEWLDYQKIRNLVKNNHNYVGILTRLRFVDGVEDFDELESIYQNLSNSKIDINRITKMTYDEILDIFYDTSINKDSKKDFELIYSDKVYSYYRVYTYEGILKIGSPAWCLKTKKWWNDYQEKFPEQWVVIMNTYKKRISTPDNWYLSKYVNIEKPWIRYGISINPQNNKWIGHDDNDKSLTGDFKSYTAFGAIKTVFNLNKGIKKSYYEEFSGCEYFRVISGSFILKVANDELFRKSVNSPLDNERINTKFVAFSESYDAPVTILAILGNGIPIMYNEEFKSKIQKVSKETFEDIINDVSKDIKELAHLWGVFYSFGKIDDKFLKEKTKYKKKSDNFLIFESTESITFLRYKFDEGYYIPVYNKEGKLVADEKSLFFKINKKDNKVLPQMDFSELSLEITQILSDFGTNKKDTKKDTKISRFLDFLR